MKQFFKDYKAAINWPIYWSVIIIFNLFILIDWTPKMFIVFNSLMLFASLGHTINYRLSKKDLLEQKKDVKPKKQQEMLNPNEMAELVSKWNWSEENKKQNVKVIKAMFEAYGEQCKQEENV